MRMEMESDCTLWSEIRIEVISLDKVLFLRSFKHILLDPFHIKEYIFSIVLLIDIYYTIQIKSLRNLKRLLKFRGINLNRYIPQE